MQSNSKPPLLLDASDPLRDYHQRAKHHLNGYALGPGGLDWHTQPNPFRGFSGCEVISLPLGDDLPSPTFAALAAGDYPYPEPLAGRSLGRLLALSLGISAWKRLGEALWALRCNPSSGNLHPTEAYAVIPSAPTLAAGTYHYDPLHHVLARRCTFNEQLAQRFQSALPQDGFLLGLSSIPWREAWKYGERAWRYCLLDSGHALGALDYAAALLGWSVTRLHHLADRDLARLLGLDRREDFPSDEPEYPQLLCLIAPHRADIASDFTLPEEILNALPHQRWEGRADRLSQQHGHHWQVVDEAALAEEKPSTQPEQNEGPLLPSPQRHEDLTLAADLMQRRRSAQAFDGTTPISSRAFFRLLDHCLPRPYLPPWGRHPKAAKIHLMLFVHRVTGVPKGLYALARSARSLPALREALRPEYTWEAIAECPDWLPLRRLLAADAQNAAAHLACHQPIAADGAFSLAMLGGFGDTLAKNPWQYRELLHEAGLLGQAVYLEAEAAGLQGTGIGCFFDDALHELLGLTDDHYQVVYQFTVGRGVRDTRILQEPPYRRKKTDQPDGFSW